MNYSINDYINSKTNNAYNFLKIMDIVYKKDKNNCIISFIYPECIDDLPLSDQDKIADLVREFLSISANIEVKFKKSYLDIDLIKKYIKNYFDKNHISIAGSFNTNTINIKKTGESININFNIDSFVKDYFFKKGIVTSLINVLMQNFCGKFFIEITEIESQEDIGNFIEERQTRLEEISIATSYINIKKRFKINVIKPLIGEPIDIDPEHITLREALGVVLAGKMKNLTQKTFKSKKAKTNKNGEQIQEEKPYFNFDLFDGNASIKAVYFPTKATYHKINLLLQEGDVFVAVKGDIEKFNDKFSLRVRSLSLCEILDNGEVIDTGEYKKETSDYNFIIPKVFEDIQQINIFNKQAEVGDKLRDKKFVVFDLETTGMDATKCEIVEIGAVKIDNGSIIETFSCFVKPKGSIPGDSTAIHGITDDMVAGAYAINQVLPDFYKFTRGATLIAHNIDFDMSFIYYNARKLGYNFDNQLIDTLALSRAKLPTLKSHKLSNVCAALGINLVGAHRAVNDTIATAQVFLKLY